MYMCIFVCVMKWEIHNRILSSAKKNTKGKIKGKRLQRKKKGKRRKLTETQNVTRTPVKKG